MPLGIFAPPTPPFRIRRSSPSLPAKVADLSSGTKALRYLDPALFWLDGSPGSTADAPLSVRRAYAAAVVCHACIRFRVQKLGEAPLLVMEEDANGDRKWVKGHPLEALLDEPNADQDMVDLLEETQTYLDLDGKALWVKVLDNAGRVVRLRCFAGQEFTVHAGVDADGAPRMWGRFRVQTQQGPRDFAPDDVVYFRYRDPNDRQGALSPTDVVLAHLNIAHDLRLRIKAALKNAALPSGIVTYRNETGRPLDDRQFERMKAEIQGMLGGVSNSGTTGLLENSTYQQTGLSLDDLKFGAVYREVEAAACMVYGVRPEIVGAIVGLENAPWSHMATARRISYEDGVAPNWNRMARTLTRQLLRPVDSDRSRELRFDTSGIPALQEDQERQARIGRIASDVLGRNERRQMLGRAPRPEPEWDEPAPSRVPGAPNRTPEDA